MGVKNFDMEKKALELCSAISRVDCRLGAYSDYEGQEHGPTFSLWRDGRKQFAEQCEEAIAAHTVAIEVWKQFQALNALRR